VSSHLDLVRSIYSDWERGDYGSSEWADAGIEYVIAGGPATGQVVPRWRAAGAFLSTWYDTRVEVEDLRELNEEWVLALDRWTGLGKGSGLDLRQSPSHSAHVFIIRDGRVTHLTAYHERDRALADLGLK
jgi:hypothetical protein